MDALPPLPYPSEQVQLQALLERIREESGTRRDIEEFATEIIERFAMIGWHVAITTATLTNDPNALTAFEIEIVGRVVEADVDHDRMAYEIQHDVAETGIRGAITRDGTVIEPSTSISMSVPEKPSPN